MILRGLERRATTETYGALDAWVRRIIDAEDGGSWSGSRVTQKTALSLSAVWRGCNLLSATVAKLPIYPYRRTADGGAERDTTHPAYGLLRGRASADHKAYDVKRTLTFHAILRGNGYAYISRNRSGAPLELLPLRPEAVEVMRSGAGPIFYRVQVGRSGSTIEGTTSQFEWLSIRAADMLHVRGLCDDGIVGYDLITVAAEGLGTALSSRRYGAAFFKQGVSGRVVIEHPLGLSAEAEERLRNSFAVAYAGVVNAHKPMVLAEGAKASVLGIDAEKAQLLERLQLDVRDIANLLGLPSHLLNDPARTSYASLEQENASFLQNSADPWLCQIEHEANAKLLTDTQRENDTHYFEFVRAALERADAKSQAEALALQVSNGTLTVNEARKIMNLPTLGPWGDRPRVPMNITVVDTQRDDDADANRKTKAELLTKLASGQTGILVAQATDLDALLAEFDVPAGEFVATPDIEEPDAERCGPLSLAAQRIVADAAERCLDRFGARACDAAKKPQQFMAWIDEQDHERTRLRESLATAVGTMLGEEAIDRAARVLMDGVRAGLLMLADVRAAELPAAAARWRLGANRIARAFAASIIYSEVKRWNAERRCAV